MGKGDRTIATDIEVIKRIKAGDERLFAILIDRYKTKAMTLAFRMLKNTHDAEDAIQESFIRAFRSLPMFEERSAFSTWFYRIVYNVCASELRKTQQEYVYLDDDDAGNNEVEHNDWIPSTLHEQTELENITLREIEKLPAKYSGILTLYCFEELGYEEISAVLQIPIGTVKTHLFRARLQLRNAIAKHYHITTEHPKGVHV
ncbi:MAG: sigma-70 family RNA polymerase sigma factor [Candidatus Kapaibacterium sp.]